MTRNSFRYTDGHVDRQTLEAALDFLVAIEPDPEEFTEECIRLGVDEGERYQNIQKEHAASIKCAEAAMKQYARQITPPTVKVMQDIFYKITNAPKYQVSTVAASISYSCLNRAWNGINGWGA